MPVAFLCPYAALFLIRTIRYFKGQHGIYIYFINVLLIVFIITCIFYDTVPEPSRILLKCKGHSLKNKPSKKNVKITTIMLTNLH